MIFRTEIIVHLIVLMQISLFQQEKITKKKQMKTIYIIIGIIVTGFICSGFFCNSVTQSGKMGDQFYSHLQENDYNAIIEMLDKDALSAYSKDEWVELLNSRNQYLGNLKSYKNTGFHKNTSNGIEITKLNYEVNNLNGLVYEEIEFIKRGNDYKILNYRFAPDLAELKGN